LEFSVSVGFIHKEHINIFAIVYVWGVFDTRGSPRLEACGALSTPLYALTVARGCSRVFWNAGSHLGTTWCVINHQTTN